MKTEDTGKIFEMAICLVYSIEYDGNFKYSIDKAESLKNRLIKLPELFPKPIHTAKKGGRYDYTAISDETQHLSAKTTKKMGKIAPQVIGQSQPQKFCEIIGIQYKNDIKLKKYIQKNITTILPILVSYTLDCPNLYYNEKTGIIQFIQLKKSIKWNKYEYTWTRDYTQWKNSTTLKISTTGKMISLVEFQFHTKSRTNMAIRWCYENFLNLFKDNLKIVLL